MLSKRDKLYLAAERLQALRCPVCGGDMARNGNDFACAQRHRVNVNRKGCLNFLSAPADSCYDAELFAARRRVFAAGCYDAVARAVEELLPEGRQRLLDAGCGDGWYLNALLERHPDWTGAGVDISVVNRFIKQFEQSQKVMKQFAGGGKKKRFGGFPGMGGRGGFPFSSSL